MVLLRAGVQGLACGAGVGDRDSHMPWPQCCTAVYHVFMSPASRLAARRGPPLPSPPPKDLKPRNVLLKGSTTDPRGFVAKVLKRRGVYAGGRAGAVNRRRSHVRWPYSVAGARAFRTAGNVPSPPLGAKRAGRLYKVLSLWCSCVS